MANKENLKEEIKIGIKFKSLNDENNHVVKHVCSCGFKSEAEYIRPKDIPDYHECAQCGNRSFLDSSKIPKDTRVAQPTFFNVTTSTRGFDVSRTNLSFIYHSEKDEFEVIQPNLIRRVVFDWVDKVLKVYKNGELEFDMHKHSTNSVQFKRAHNHIMKNIEYIDFFYEIQVPNIEFYKYINKEEVSNGWSTSVSHKRVLYSLANAIENYESYNAIQILSTAGFKNLKSLFTTTGGTRYWNPTNINVNETKPHKILGLSKRMTKYLKNANFDYKSKFETLKRISNDPEKVKIIYPILEVINENYELNDFVNKLEDICHMKITHGYDVLRLLEFLVDDLPMTQGITSPEQGLQLLRDYADMSRTMRVPFDKYPRSLKKEHDVVTLNHYEWQKENEKEGFANIMKDNQYLVDISKKRKYSIILPKTSQDLIEKGGKLGHCVGSYIPRVSKGETIIAFMREKDHLDEPYVTVQVSNNQVRQARGKFNRGLTKDETDYLKEWAKEKRIYY